MNSRRKRLHSLLSYIINVYEPSLKESAGTQCREKVFLSTASHFKSVIQGELLGMVFVAVLSRISRVPLLSGKF